jgi:spermidine synthase
MSLAFWVLEGVAGALLLLLLLYRFSRRRRSRVLASRQGRGARVVVARTPDHLELWLTSGEHETLQARVRRDDPLVSALAYTDGFHLFPPPDRARVLFVGAGAGIGPRQLARFHRDLDITVVDHDPAVLEVAARWFGLRAGPGLAVIAGDGRERLERAAPASWDLIVLDTFGAGVYPASLATVEAFRLCRDRLRDPGLLIVNLGGTLCGSGSRLPSVWAGIVEAFGANQTRAFGVPLPGEPTFDPTRPGNTLVYAFRGRVPAPEPDRLPPDRVPALASIARCPVTPTPAAPHRDGDTSDLLPIL